MSMGDDSKAIVAAAALYFGQTVSPKQSIVQASIISCPNGEEGSKTLMALGR